MQKKLTFSSFIGERRITDCSAQVVVRQDICNENYICELILFCFHALQKKYIKFNLTFIQNHGIW